MLCTFMNRANATRRLLQVLAATAFPKREDDSQSYHSAPTVPSTKDMKIARSWFEVRRYRPSATSILCPTISVYSGLTKIGSVSRQTWLHYTWNYVYGETSGRVCKSGNHDQGKFMYDAVLTHTF